MTDLQLPPAGLPRKRLGFGQRIEELGGEVALDFRLPTQNDRTFTIYLKVLYAMLGWGSKWLGTFQSKRNPNHQQPSYDILVCSDGMFYIVVSEATEEGETPIELLFTINPNERIAPLNPQPAEQPILQLKGEAKGFGSYTVNVVSVDKDGIIYTIQESS